MKQPTGRMTLSAQEGEAMLGRLSVYAPSRSDGEVLMEVLRWHFWLMWIIDEAKMSLKTLRTLLFGRGPKPPELSPAEVTPACALSSGDSEATDSASSGDAAVGSLEDAVSPPKAKGGHRPGMGCLGTLAYSGATHIE